ncbi:MAG: protein kinase [Deltaproteobacteria bacterium]|nr:protein kinase [Deltaproteobacteria bacterium]
MVNRIFNPNLIVGAVIAFLFTVLSIVHPPVLAGLEQQFYDTYSRLSASDAPAPGKVALVEIDQRSLDRIGAWPWPRGKVAELVDRLDRAGARVIGLLVPLQDPSRGTGYETVRDFQEKLNAHPLSSQQGKLAEWVRVNLERMAQELDEDGRLAESVRRSGKVVVPVYARFEKRSDEEPQKPVQIMSESLLGPATLPEAMKRRITATDLELPFERLAEAAAGFGHASLTVGNNDDGRRHALLIRYRGALIPSMPLRLAAAYQGRDLDRLSVREDRIRLESGVLQIVDGGVLLPFSQDRPQFDVHSSADILAGRKLKAIRGRAALVAFGRGVGRSYRTPVDPDMPEGRLGARSLTALMAGRCITRPAVLPYLEPVLVLSLGLLTLFFCSRLGYGGSLGAAAGLGAAGFAAGFAALSASGVWLRTGTAIACLVLVCLATLFQRLFLSPSKSKEAIETNRLLGLSFQSQGLPDLAFDKFKKLPLDEESRNLMYNLGLEHERNRMNNKALEVYEHINKGGGYRDLDDRIPRLRESDRASTPGGQGAAREGNVPGEAGGEGRSRVGRFEILGELGRGSMGVVYKARDPKINRMLAIKTIRFSDEFEEDVIQEIKGRFFTEAEIAGQLSHPSIVTIYDVGDDGDLTYMAMEYLKGKDLDKFISRESLLPLPKVLDVVARVAEALAFAHEAGVIHRDVKPANIMLLDSGGVKVTDFGIAKAISSTRTRTGVILGTPNYMSPEQIMGRKIDHRSDIFSLGVLFFQLLTGELPFRGENLSNLLYQITQVRHPSIREINPKLPKACEQIIDKALTKNPADRFQSAAETAKLLRLLHSKIEQLRRQSPRRQPRAGA